MGSVSAVTFITAAGYLDTQDMAWSGYLVVAMALMESPSTIFGILLYLHFGRVDRGDSQSFFWKQLLGEPLYSCTRHDEAAAT